MKKLQKFKDAFNVLVSVAKGVAALAEIWKRIKPEVIKIVTPIYEGCKKLASDSSNHTPIVIEGK